MPAGQPPEYQAAPRPLAGFGCTVEPTQRGVTIHLRGDFDLAALATFDRAVDEREIHTAPRVILDLSHLEFIDSTGLRAVARLQARLDGRLLVVRGPERVHRVFELTDLANVLAFTDASGD